MTMLLRKMWKTHSKHKSEYSNVIKTILIIINNFIIFGSGHIFIR